MADTTSPCFDWQELEARVLCTMWNELQKRWERLVAGAAAELSCLQHFFRYVPGGPSDPRLVKQARPEPGQPSDGVSLTGVKENHVLLS
ncbi:hypothetical protein GOODEAATRI_024682 [Goodea atripinnis]|uniref:Uncharacterized protein n=1 Tax=Goodea atripinnis TaxID=208336 RepID=A0ABV0PRL2_9TELE